MAKRIYSTGIVSFLFGCSLIFNVIKPAEAQSSGPIVLICPFGDGSETLTIDLGNRLVTDHFAKANPGGFPDPLVEDRQGQIITTTDEVITWHIFKRTSPVAGYHPENNPIDPNSTSTLNRYSLMLGDQIQCRKQEKQL